MSTKPDLFLPYNDATIKRRGLVLFVDIIPEQTISTNNAPSFAALFVGIVIFLLQGRVPVLYDG